MMICSRYTGLLPCTRSILCGRNRLFQSTDPLQVLFSSDSTFLTSDDEVSSNQGGSVRSFKTAAWRKRSLTVKNRVRLAAARYKKPGQILALSMPLSPPEMDNSTLVMLAQLGKHLNFTEPDDRS
jgi:hypothetical protein